MSLTDAVWLDPAEFRIGDLLIYGEPIEQSGYFKTININFPALVVSPPEAKSFIVLEANGKKKIFFYTQYRMTFEVIRK